MESATVDEELIRFLKLVPSARWRKVPEGWNEQFRAALSERLVKVGWGGIIELTATALDLLLHLPPEQERQPLR
jgi:hypothetical protein